MINSAFNRLRLFFWALCTGSGAMMPFLTIYYSHYLGLSDVQVGILSAITPVTTFILNPYWCAIADKYHAHKRILVVCAIFSSFITMGLYLIPGYQTSEPWFSDRFVVCVMVIFMFSAFNAPIGAILDTIVIAKLRILMEKGLINSKDPRDAYGRCRFVGSLAYGVGAFAMSSLMDNSSSNRQTMLPMFYGWIICIGFVFPLCLLFPERNPVKFRLRSFSSIVGSSNSIVRVAPLDITFDDEDEIILKEAPRPNQVMAEKDIATQEIIEISINNANNSNVCDDEKSVNQSSIFKLAKEIIDHPSGVGNTYVFWLYIFSKGCAFSIINNFLFLMMIQKLQASSMLLGYVSIARILFEMPFFYWSGKLSLHLLKLLFPSINDRIQKKNSIISGGSNDAGLILGMRWSLVITMILMTCRLAAIAVIGILKLSPWLLLVVESFHGIIFAMYYGAAVQIAAKQAPTHLQGLSQGIFNAIYGGFGPFIGCLFGGYIYSLNPNALFAAMAICTTLMSFVYAWDIRRTNNSRPPSSDQHKTVITSVILVE